MSSNWRFLPLMFHPFYVNVDVHNSSLFCSAQHHVYSLDLCSYSRYVRNDTRTQVNVIMKIRIQYLSFDFPIMIQITMFLFEFKTPTSCVRFLFFAHGQNRPSFHQYSTLTYLQKCLLQWSFSSNCATPVKLLLF